MATADALRWRRIHHGRRHSGQLHSTLGTCHHCSDRTARRRRLRQRYGHPRGFAIDRASTTGTGIDRVYIYLDGPYGTGTIIGGGNLWPGPARVGLYGDRFRYSGWELVGNASGIAPGVHRLYLYAHRTTDNAWSVMDPHLVVVRAAHGFWLPLGIKS